MLLGEPSQTQFDLNFSVFGFRVRIAPFFWLAALLLGFGSTQNSLARVLLGTGPDAEGMNPNLLLIWILAVLLSILIHELGHALAFRYFGIQSHIVLYHFGGLAIPDAYGAAFGSRRRDSHSQIIISLAGPLAQIGGAILLILIIAATGHRAPAEWLGFVGRILPTPAAPGLPPGFLLAFAVFFLYVSVYWALLNLLPVYPLDGGQVSRELFMLFSRGDGIRQSLMLSVFAAGAVAVLAILNGQDLYLFIMFGMLGYSSYQTLQAYGGGYGGRW